MERSRFIDLVRREQKSLRRFLLALCCGNQSEADDIAQESLVKAYLSSDDFRDEGKFRSWIYRIAHNTFLDHVRLRKLPEPLERAAVMPDEENDSDRSFRYQELYEAISILPPKERSAILLYYINGYSIKEIAVIVDSKPDAVKQQLSRGRERLRFLIER